MQLPDLATLKGAIDRLVGNTALPIGGVGTRDVG
jgi:hypothetical protein